MHFYIGSYKQLQTILENCKRCLQLDNWNPEICSARVFKQDQDEQNGVADRKKSSTNRVHSTGNGVRLAANNVNTTDSPRSERK